MKYTFYHEKNEDIKTLYEDFTEFSEMVEPEIIAVVEFDCVDIMLQMEKKDKKVILTLYSNIRIPENQDLTADETDLYGRWVNDEYITTEDITDIITYLNSWSDIETYLKSTLMLWCKKKNYDYRSKLIYKESN